MRWVKLHKSMLEWRWHDQPETVSLFVHLIMMARETDGCETCSASAARVMFLYRQAAQKYWS